MIRISPQVRLNLLDCTRWVLHALPFEELSRDEVDFGHCACVESLDFVGWLTLVECFAAGAGQSYGESWLVA